MKRILSLALACTLALSPLAGCAAPSSTKQLTAAPARLTDQEMVEHDPEVPAVYEALSGFGLDLLKAVRREGEGALVSPLSVSLALSMAANGAEGETLAQFESVLGGGADLDALNVACNALMSIYQSGLGGSTQANLANSVWVDPEGQISEDFIGRCMGVFDAEVFQGDLSAPTIVEDVNGWVSAQTGKLIPEIIQGPFPEETAVLLVNALYLKNTWQYEFDPNSTSQRDFTHRDGRTSRPDFLNKGSAALPYIQGEGAQGVVLPYDDGRLAFFALMPGLYPDSPDLGQWLDSLEGDALSRLVLGAEETLFLHLALPKFEAEWSGQLQDSLRDLGLDAALTPGLADFSGMGDHPNGYFLSQVIHAAKIQVNEKGTEAAAATVVAAPGAGAPPEEGVTLVFDRPFLYGIMDLQNGVPLFLGTYE